MKATLLGTAICASLSLTACGQRPPTPGPEATSTTGAGGPEPAASASSAPSARGDRLFVDAQLVDCEGGAGPMKCLRTRATEGEDWTLHYDGIEGFTHEAGYAYELRVEVVDVPNPPADASSRKLRLVEVVAKRAASK